MEKKLNNINILVGSVKQALDRRLILGDAVSSETIVLFNTLKKNLNYCITQYNMGNTEYSSKIKKLEDLIFSLKYGCPQICNYRDFGTLLDFKASNAKITIDTLEYKISQLQIII